MQEAAENQRRRICFSNGYNNIDQATQFPSALTSEGFFSNVGEPYVFPFEVKP